MHYYLNDYTRIGSNQLLKIKLRDKAGFIYGNLGTVVVDKSGPASNDPNGAAKATVGSLQQFFNYEDCLADKHAVPGFKIISIKSSDIESIGIIEDEVFDS